MSQAAVARPSQPAQQSIQHSGQQRNAPQGQGHPPATSAGAPAGDTAGWVLEQHYDILGKIGEGTYGVVYLATSKQDKKQVYAIKKFKTGREGDGISPTAIREILLLRELKHEHIVKLTAVHINRSEPSLSLAFDYAEHDLYEIIWHHRDRLAGPIDLYVIKSLMWQLLNGLSYLHQNWIIHRDLKPSNILVMGEGPEAGQVKVGDFGLARFFQAPLKPLAENGVVVTIWYRPPELLLGGRHYTRAVDMWGAGCIFAELLTLRPLFQGQEVKQPGAPFQFDQLDRIFKVLGHPNPRTWPHIEQLPHWANNKDNIRVKKPEWGANRLEAHLSDVLKQLGEAFARGSGNRGPVSVPKLTPAGINLLQQMLVYDPLKRITAEEALQHPYFQEHPRPGPNAFVCEGRRIASYPRRHKQTAFLSTGPGAVGHSGAPPPAAAAAAAHQQQPEPEGAGLATQQQQQRVVKQQRPGQQRPGHVQQARPGSQQQQQPGVLGKKRKLEAQGRRPDHGIKPGGANRYGSR